MLPGAGGSAAPYVVGALVMAGAIAGMVFWRRSKDAPQGAPTTAITAAPSASAAPKVDSKLPEFAPPPLREDDAPSASAMGNQGKAAPAPGGGPMPKGGCADCGQGVSTGALDAAIRSRAGTAQGCYNRALRDGGAEGTIMVSVSVGSDGGVCGANVVSDSLHNPAINACVVSKMMSGGYPKPQEGCVTRQVPISFKVK
jgi:outer membrane biosynthesis protein TonB